MIKNIDKEIEEYATTRYIGYRFKGRVLCNIIVRREIFFKAGGFKQPPNSLGIDKVFSDSIIYLIRKLKKGKLKTLNFISVLTSGRHLTVRRSLKRINQYVTKKEIYYELAKKIK